MKNPINTIVVLLAVLLAQTAGAQKIILGAGGGYATFGMEDSKAFNRSVQNRLPFSPVLTDNFPDWYYYQAEALYSFPGILAAGLKLSAASTGSRLHLADYSGEYTFDNLQQVWVPGIKLLVGKAPGRRSGPCFSAEGGMAFSTMTLDETAVVYEEHAGEHLEFKARGFYVQPGLSYLQYVGEYLIVSANVSWYQGFESGYYKKGSSNQKITNTETGEKVKPGWNGLRAGIVVYWGINLE